MHLLGIDVGFSQTRKSTGVAWYGPDGFGAKTATSDCESRLACLPPKFHADLAAIDGPLIPSCSDPQIVRHCERCLARGAFNNRCKPGFSHAGQGYKLRTASGETVMHVCGIVKKSHSALREYVLPSRAIVEAFPNAFIGVLLKDAVYAARRPLKRGKKFDWLYNQAIEADIFERVLKCVGLKDCKLVGTMQQERNHEKRAAYICLLTAACAASGKSKMVGNSECGWFCLPPMSLWEGWAKDALEAAEQALEHERQ